ncbi:MAG TPA: hypothetical protein VGH38_19875 [Bryobacteraceae bacterium]
MWSFNKSSAAVVLLAAGAWPLSAGPVQFRSHELPRAVFGAAYHSQIQTQVDGQCPVGDVVLEVANGNLPRGIELSGDVLAGIPREFGLFRIQLRGANRCAAAVQDFTLEVTGKPILRVTPEELSFEYREGDPTPKPQVAMVSGSWDDLPYAVRLTGAPWLSFHTDLGATPYAGSAFSADRVTVQVSPEGLAPGVYHGAMSFSADMGANMPQIAVTFRVLAKRVTSQGDTQAAPTPDPRPAPAPGTQPATPSGAPPAPALQTKPALPSDIRPAPTPDRETGSPSGAPPAPVLQTKPALPSGTRPAPTPETHPELLSGPRPPPPSDTQTAPPSGAPPAPALQTKPALPPGTKPALPSGTPPTSPANTRPSAFSR